jgi:phosphoheptose isomerase
MSHVPQLQEAIAPATKTLQSLVDLDAQLGTAAALIEECLRSGNKLLVCGNGGSATDASHFAPIAVAPVEKSSIRTCGAFCQGSTRASGDVSRER